MGASGNDDDGNYSGSAYLFDVSDLNNPVQIYKLTAADAAAYDVFGLSVAISGSTAIVGAFHDDDVCPSDPDCDSGSAYLFDVATGNQIAKLTSSDATNGDGFGISVAINGNTAIVGAYKNDAAGSAYLFDVSDPNNPVQTYKLTASDAAIGDSFGYSVTVSGNTAIVGAYLDDDAGTNSGSAYLFDVSTGSQIAKLTASDAASIDYFGRSVAITGNTAIVGARLDDDGGTDSGSAYIFENLCAPKPSCDLLVTSEDITFAQIPGTPGLPNTIMATIWNVGEAAATDIVVVFSDFDGPIGEPNIIPLLNPGESKTVGIKYAWPEADFRLITVTIDPAGDIPESDETNNDASKLYQIGYRLI